MALLLALLVLAGLAGVPVAFFYWWSAPPGRLLFRTGVVLAVAAVVTLVVGAIVWALFLSAVQDVEGVHGWAGSSSSVLSPGE